MISRLVSWGTQASPQSTPNHLPGDTASLPSAVSAARIKSDYAEELKDFSEWYFKIFPTMVESGDVTLVISDTSPDSSFKILWCIRLFKQR